jgi:hypothetical protein
MSFSILGIKLKDAREVELPTLLGLSGLSGLSQLSLMSPLCVDAEGDDAINKVMMDECVHGTDRSDSSASSCASTDTEYYMYSRVETHMHISMSLYCLNKEGQDIINQLESKKHANANVDANEYRVLYTVYSALLRLINFRRMSYDVYCDLINALDGVMCDECGEIDTFYVKDDAFTLESMYYRQETWITEFESFPDAPNVFEFAPSAKMDLGECSYMLLYMRKYNALIDMIESSFGEKKIQNITVKMKDKLMGSISILEHEIEELLKADE